MITSNISLISGWIKRSNAILIWPSSLLIVHNFHVDSWWNEIPAYRVQVSTDTLPMDKLCCVHHLLCLYANHYQEPLSKFLSTECVINHWAECFLFSRDLLVDFDRTTFCPLYSTGNIALAHLLFRAEFRNKGLASYCLCYCFFFMYSS